MQVLCWLHSPGGTLCPKSPNFFYTRALGMQLLQQWKNLLQFFLISSEKSQAAVNPSSFLVMTQFWLSFLRRIWCQSPGCCVVLGMEGSSRATPAPGQPSSQPSTLSRVMGHGCVVEGNAVSVIHFSFMHSYLTLILAAGKTQAKEHVGLSPSVLFLPFWCCIELVYSGIPFLFPN